MSNILGYLKEWGDVPFNKVKFNEVDNVVLSQISYLEFEGIVPNVNEEGYVTVAEAYERFAAKYSKEELCELKYINEDTPRLLKVMAAGARFKGAKLSNYISQVDENEGKQFSALHIELSNETTYVAFRGTDDNLISWQEDFCMSYKIVPAQKAAADYLYDTMKGSNRKFRVGGHSKGGNLAVYAAMKCSAKMQERIIEIYDNDGPGFEDVILQSLIYKNIQNKIVRITPAFSLVGTLFEHKGYHKIVSSRAKRIAQHDAMTWEVSGNEFVYEEKFAKRSRLLSKALQRWINGLRLDQRKEVVKTLFNNLQAKGIEKMSDLLSLNPKQLLQMFSTAKLSKPTKMALMALVASFVTIYGKELIALSMTLKLPE